MRLSFSVRIIDSPASIASSPCPTCGGGGGSPTQKESARVGTRWRRRRSSTRREARNAVCPGGRALRPARSFEEYLGPFAFGASSSSSESSCSAQRTTRGRREFAPASERAACVQEMPAEHTWIRGDAAGAPVAPSSRRRCSSAFRRSSALRFSSTTFRLRSTHASASSCTGSSSPRVLVLRSFSSCVRRSRALKVPSGKSNVKGATAGGRQVSARRQGR